MSKRVRIPYGVSNFKSLQEQDYYFVDKTKYIEILENFNEKYLTFLRPRRFGKSLFLSLLEYYYDLNYAQEKLFDEYYIGKNPTPLKSSYHTLRFTFSGINTDSEQNTVNGFNFNVVAGIELFLKRNQLNISLDYKKNTADLITEFFSKVTTLLSSNIYLLIDEYDHFANELLGFNEQFFKSSVSQNGFVRKFYEAIKEGTATGIVDRIFITGVSPITLDSMTSGFNIGCNLTTDSMLNEMVGFTQDEVIKLAKETIGENFDIEANIHNLASYYDGYKFHHEGKEKLFNSDMILYYFSHYQRKGKAPEDYIDRNIASDYSKIGKLFEVGGKTGKRMEVLKSIIRGEELSFQLTYQFNLENIFNIDDFKSLLFYMGFATIKRADEFGDLYMQYPNYVIKELYFDYFEKLIRDEIGFDINDSDIRNAIKNLAKFGDIKPLLDIAADILHRLSTRDFIKFDEKYLKVILLTLLFKSNVYFAKSEYEVEDGYIDIALLKGSVGMPTYFAILELKYIAKKDFTQELLQAKLAEAKEQLAKYNQSKELLAISNLKKFAIVFCFDECVALEEI